MKRILSYIISAAFMFLLNSCLSDPNMKDEVINGGAPVVENLKMDEKQTTATSVVLYAEITKENGIPVVDYGFKICEAETNDTVPYSVGTDKGKKVFSKEITELDNGKIYKVKAYAKNALDLYFETVEMTVTTKVGYGVIETELPDTIRGTSAVLKAKIIVMGEGDIAVRGFYFSRREDMADKDSTVIVNLKTDSLFTSRITGLTPLTTYYVKAFARNKFGMFVSEFKPKSFKTTDGTARLSKPVVLGKTDEGVLIEAEVLDGGDAFVFERGICWGETENPTISNDTTQSGNGVGTFNALADSLTPKKQYYARAYARNSFGVIYSEQVSFLPKSNLPSVKTYDVEIRKEHGTVLVKGEVVDQGSSPVLVSGVCWGTNAMPTIANDTLHISSGVKVFEGVISKLKGGTEYYIRAFAINSSGVEYADNEVRTFRTPPVFESAKPFSHGVLIENSNAAFVIGQNAFILGGDKGSECTDSMFMYNSAAKEWSNRLPFLGGKQKWQTAIGIDNYGYVFGGSTGGNNPQLTNKVYRYSLNRNVWIELNTNSGPEPFHSARAAYVLGSTYLIGGYRNNATDEVWQFNGSDTWEKKAKFPIKQYAGIALTVGSKMYAGLGYVNTNEDTTNKIWVSSGDMNSWSDETSMPGGGKAKGGVVFNDLIYIIDDLGVIRQYNPSTKTWKAKSALKEANRKINCVYSINSVIYIGLGDNSSELIMYNPAWDN